MKKQPGVMLYFEIRPCLRRATCDQQGQLFNAILNYGEYDIVPDFDGALGIAWDFIQPRLDRDRERYQQISQKRREIMLARWDRQRQTDMDTEGYNSIELLPTAPSLPNTTSLSATMTATTAAENSAE